MTPQEVVEEIYQHVKDNPSHGVGCVCMDEYICKIRAMFTIPELEPPGLSRDPNGNELTKYFESPENKAAYQVRRVLSIALNSLYKV